MVTNIEVQTKKM